MRKVFVAFAKVAGCYLTKKTMLSCVLFALPFMRVVADADPNFYVYLCFGQSNMEGNAAAEPADYRNVSDRFQMLATTNFDNPKRTMGQWYTATPPIVSPAGKLGVTDYFGRTMVAALPDEVKVGVVAVAMGGSPIEMFDKDKYEKKMKDNPGEWWVTLAKNYYGGNPYKRLIDMGKKAQEKGVIKGFLLHQGCSNNGDPNWPKMVKKIYEDMLADLGLQAEDVPLFVGETLRQNQGGACYAHNNVVARMPSVVPTSHVISSKDVPGNGVDPWHFSAEGYRILGKRYAIEALRLMGIEYVDDPNEEPEQPQGLVPGEQFTDVASLVGESFAIVSATEQKALYGSDNQNLGYDEYEQAFADTNAGYLFKAKTVKVDGSDYFLLRLMTPFGGEYSIWGSPGYLNSQEATGWCSFILGNTQKSNGQDIDNGAVWDIQYVDGKGFSLRNVGTGLYLYSNAPANSDSPYYWNLCKLQDASAATAINTVGVSSRPAVVYDLSGRRVAHPTKGLYIVNGKKVILK